ncbi:membrane protein [Bacillus phage TsarBomba]|uniref:Uncharacterized protein n=1 Tax=Bacillus phage TsarBomba TaxID=1690456 RepID=A0A0K2D038_9CAUD|nr:membrane protein [Bacillus phage TsarBomba]ALA13110.1 hypothetical protein TSARBOMBA_240 [Bacillus phage TsarBomba]
MSDKAVNWLMDRADKLGGFIDELAKQLGVAATHVYEVLVKQQFVDGVSLLVKALIWLVVVAIVWFLVNKLIIKKWEMFADEGIEVLFGFVIAGAIVFTIIVAWNEIDWITLGIKKLMNPEYYALQDLMDFVKGQVDKK